MQIGESMAPSMGRRVAAEAIVETELASDEPNGEGSAEILFALISAQWLAASTTSSNEVVPEPFGKEAKRFTEIRVLHREEAVSLLYELSESETLCEKIGSLDGAILILVGMTSSKSENLLTIEKADKYGEVVEFLNSHRLSRDAKATGIKWDDVLGELREMATKVFVELAVT